MPNIARTIAAAINTTAQPLIGWQYVTTKFRVADVFFAIVKAAATDLVTINIVTGGREIAIADQVPISASTIWPDDFLWSDRVKFGDYITLDIIQGAVSANPILFMVRMNPVS